MEFNEIPAPVNHAVTSAATIIRTIDYIIENGRVDMDDANDAIVYLLMDDDTEFNNVMDSETHAVVTALIASLDDTGMDAMRAHFDICLTCRYLMDDHKMGAHPTDTIPGVAGASDAVVDNAFDNPELHPNADDDES